MVLRIPSGIVNTNYLCTELSTMRFRVESLESQLHELESETENLSHSLDYQKARTVEAEAAGQKRADELLKEIQKKVRSRVRDGLPMLNSN